MPHVRRITVDYALGSIDMGHAPKERDWRQEADLVLTCVVCVAEERLFTAKGMPILVIVNYLLGQASKQPTIMSYNPSGSRRASQRGDVLNRYLKYGPFYLWVIDDHGVVYFYRLRYPALSIYLISSYSEAVDPQFCVCQSLSPIAHMIFISDSRLPCSRRSSQVRHKLPYPSIIVYVELAQIPRHSLVLSSHPRKQ